MLNPDELIEAGFATLKGAAPRQSPADLAVLARRREAKARVKKLAVAGVGCLMIAGGLGVVLKPTSALAALAEAKRLSSAQPIVHVHIESIDFLKNPTIPPWPQTPGLDIWKFSDRYFRKQGYTLTEQFKDGRMLAYDSRFTEGFSSTYDAATDSFWKFDGTIGIELTGMHREPPTVRDVVAHGRHFTRYEWQDTDAMHNHSTEHVDVDPQSKLICFTDGHRETANGDTNEGTGMIEYPNSAVAAQEVPRFPIGLKYRTKKELLQEFNRTIGNPEQSKVLAGIRTTLYGVVVHPNIPDGIGIDVITTGGAGPDYGSGHQPEIVGAKLLAAKRSEWFPPLGDPLHARYGRHLMINGRKYILNQSDDLLTKAPTKITIRVPVWRLSQNTVDRNGKSVHPHDFVGYVTFSTSKMFFSLGASDWSYYPPQVRSSD